MDSNIKLSCSRKNGDYEIIHKGFSWVSDGRKPYIIIRKKIGEKYISTFRLLSSALRKETQQSPTQIVRRYSDFVAFGKKLPFTLVRTAEITGSDTVEFSLKARMKQAMIFRRSIFRRLLIPKSGVKNPTMLTLCGRAFCFRTDTGRISLQLSALRII